MSRCEYIGLLKYCNSHSRSWANIVWGKISLRNDSKYILDELYSDIPYPKPFRKYCNVEFIQMPTTLRILVRICSYHSCSCLLPRTPPGQCQALRTDQKFSQVDRKSSTTPRLYSLQSSPLMSAPSGQGQPGKKVVRTVRVMSANRPLPQSTFPPCPCNSSRSSRSKSTRNSNTSHPRFNNCARHKQSSETV